jgi:hypothetical protein
MADNGRGNGWCEAIRCSALWVWDEMGTNTSLAPFYACSLKDRRAYSKEPPNLGKNMTLPLSMSLKGNGTFCYGRGLHRP